MKRIALAALLALAAGPAAAPARADVKTGTITIGHGIAGATLGMTRAQVIDVLGKPVDESDYGALDFTHIEGGTIFEAFVGQKSHRVNGFQLDAKGSGFKLADGNAVFARGGQKRLFEHYGARLHQNQVYQGQKSYSIRGRLHGRRVITTFLVTKFSHTSGKVYEVDIDYLK